MLLLALLLAAPAPKGLVAVLEFQNRVRPGAEVDAGYFSNRVRTAALDALPGLQLLTQENMLTLLEASGKKLEDCEGECEVETGRRLGAEWVVSGDIVRLGSTLRLNLRLHETRGGLMLSGAQASGRSQEELDSALAATVRKLLVPLAPPPPAPAGPARAPTGTLAPTDVVPPPPPAITASRDVQARIPEVIWFDDLSWELSQKSQRTLDSVAKTLRRSGWAVRIEGHAASDEASIKETSKRRATAVRDYLIEKGVPSDRLPIRAVGVASSVAVPGSQKGAGGRRVEFVLAD